MRSRLRAVKDMPHAVYSVVPEERSPRNHNIRARRERRLASRVGLAPPLFLGRFVARETDMESLGAFKAKDEIGTRFRLCRDSFHWRQ
jgi:hypothetical protein